MPERALDGYIAFYEGLTPETLGILRNLCAEDVRFRDPFNDLRGIDAYIRVLEKMFEDVAAPQFRVSHKACDGNVCFLRWTFGYRPHADAPDKILEGMSEVHFDDAGLVIAHIDHWDPAGQIYESLPVIGWLLRIIRRRVSVEG